jgi:hypothetical protein
MMELKLCRIILFLCQDVPEDFIFLTRVIGLLRGLTAELECSCPIMVILALHARLGLVTP